MNNNGLLLIFSGPSGAGKGTVLKELLNGNDNMKLSVSATTRTPREGECHGVHYFFMTKEEFEEQIANGQMLEHAEYCGKYYGTPSSQIMDWIEEGRDVVLEIEVQGHDRLKKSVLTVSAYLYCRLPLRNWKNGFVIAIQKMKKPFKNGWLLLAKKWKRQEITTM